MADRGDLIYRMARDANTAANRQAYDAIVAAVEAEDRLSAAQAALEQTERDKSRAVYIAEHLFQMVPKEAWREQGAEYMGQYAGDHWAEQTREELRALTGSESPPVEAESKEEA